jgi:hypothetical protein
MGKITHKNAEVVSSASEPANVPLEPEWIREKDELQDFVEDLQQDDRQHF